jgi:hypothetical protein
MFEHELFGKIDVETPLKQRHVEGFWEALREAELTKHSHIYNDGRVVAIACEVGIVKEKIDVPDSDPALINWLAAEIVEYVNKAREVPEKN